MKFRLPTLPSLGSLLSASMPSVQIDPDEHLYRQLSQSPRDLLPIEQDRMLRLAHYLYQRNGLARRIIEIPLDFVMGEGISVSSDDPAIDEIMRRHWSHPINSWATKGEQRFLDLRLFGEACWPVVETPGSGVVVLGAVDPSAIKEVITDPIQADEADVVVLKAAAGGREQRFRVIRPVAESDSWIMDRGDADGLCFYFAINKVAVGTRGISDLFALIDYIDGADQFLWSQLERARIANAMVYDVTVDGDEQAVQAEADRIRKSNITRPGGVNVHGKGVSWDIKTANLGASDAETMGRLLQRWALGGAGLPEHYFGSGDQANRATAAEMNDPTTKRMTRIQTGWCAIIDRILRYQYERARAHGADVPALDPGKPMPWKINKPEISAKDLAKVGAVLSQITASLAEAEDRGYISTETARRGFVMVARLAGIEADAAEEAEKVAQQPKTALTDYAKTPPDQLAAALRK